VAEAERAVMAELAGRLSAAGIDCPGVSIGSTPAMSVVEDLAGITEVRPGNYVFYDYTQVCLGACEVRDCALSVVASVVSSQPGAKHCVIDAGALSLSKDPGPSWVRPRTLGEIYAAGSADGRDDAAELAPDLRVVSLSQEHGIVNQNLPVGRRLRILPNHACLAIPCFDHYILVRGQEVVGRAPICR
ncbi:MAG: DSD1 family PLP-dependent enzyme, partial [Acidobacteriota bacterium]